MMDNNENQTRSGSAVGTAVSIAAGLSFYVLCMILPLVGPAGIRVPHAAKNQATFLSVLMVTLLLAITSIVLSMRRRREEGGSLPRFPIGLAAVCLVFLVILLFNGFAI